MLSFINSNVKRKSAKSFAKHSNRNNNAGKNYTGLHIVHDMSGKMKKCNGVTMWSLSSAAELNSHCIARIEDAIARNIDCICLHCYALAAVAGDDDRSAGMARNLRSNYEILTKSFLTWEDIPVITSDFFRFESHGDIENVIQLINYFMFCEKALEYGSKTQFALWTKNIDILEIAFDAFNIAKPENLQIMYSSAFVDEVAPIDNAKHWYIDRIFTVWSCAENAIAAGHEMNCCDGKEKRYCTICQKCYTKNSTRYINEILR